MRAGRARHAMRALLRLGWSLATGPALLFTGETKHTDSRCHSYPFTSSCQVSLSTEILFIRWLRCALRLAVKNGRSHPRGACGPN